MNGDFIQLSRIVSDQSVSDFNTPFENITAIDFITDTEGLMIIVKIIIF